MDKKFYLLIIVLEAIIITAAGQNVGIGTTSPNNSAALDVTANNKGVLLPRLTSLQRKAISNPATGLLVFDTDRSTLMFFDGVAWKALSFSDENKTNPISRNGSDIANSASFGTRVSISGNYAIAGAPRYNNGGASNIGAAYIFNKTTTGWKQQAKLVAYDSAANAYFGGSVAISGDYAIVGSCTKAVNGITNQGRAYVYHRSGNSWLLDSAFNKTSGAAFEYFGWAVGISAFTTGGPAIAIGIPYSDVGGSDKGEVYFYKKTGTSWSFTQNVIPGDLGISDIFGTTISMDSDYVAIGAPAQENITYSLTDAGAAYVYVFGGGVWNFQQKLSGFTARGQFGLALSIFSDKLAVGAPWANSYTNTSASVSLFKRTGSSWTGTSSLYIFNYEIVPGASQINSNSSTTTSISISNLTFGMSVCLSGNTLLVGASGGIEYPNGGSSYYTDRAGTVYVYKNLYGNTYTRSQIITADYPNFGDLFGQSVAMSNGTYLIANPHATVNGIPSAGNVLFGYDPN